ncbi:hypothetical protein E2562_032079 [Oryza meyeriana var. granulata]|uniref:BTB domain-containing protein n=1 Tax=Oryza meyeriana var. granulata TaxID=110450 RepID=A0A6G1CK66_9ORYZ|nr:hypothetical protein E2562_032079 [Oryza meyeriana var. granulata]
MHGDNLACWSCHHHGVNMITETATPWRFVRRLVMHHNLALIPIEGSSQGSNSRLVPTTARGTHVFTVDGYSLHRQLGTDKYINSAIFAVGGYDWCLLYYPDDVYNPDDNDKRYISIGLQLISKSVEVFHNDDRKCTLGTPNIMIDRNEVEELACLCDDRLVIECDITVIKGSLVRREEATMAGDDDINHKQLSSSSDLSKDMVKMLKAKVGADVAFNVAGEVFMAHRVVLAAQSPVFKTELYRPMRARRGQQIAIKDMQPAVFNALLYFMYTDELLSPDMGDLDGDDKMELIKHLLSAADRYGVDKLKILRENSLYKSLDVENVVNTFALADQHNCHKLKDACAQCIASPNRLDDVVASKGYGRYSAALEEIKKGMAGEAEDGEDGATALGEVEAVAAHVVAEATAMNI